MYTLRSIQNNTNGVESNHQLGATYTFFNRDKFCDDPKFVEHLNFYGLSNYSTEDLDDLNVKGFLVGETGLHLLHADTTYYIMTDSGKTFESIRFKD